MDTQRLTTQRLAIIPQTQAETLAMVEAMRPEDRVHVSPAWLALVNGPPELGHWAYGFSVTGKTGGEKIGTAGFKGPPVGGVVEIAYAVEAAHRGKGYASEIAAALTGYALSFAEVKSVRAHTAVDGIASQRALARAGFSFTGDVVDPEDGPVKRFDYVP